MSDITRKPDYLDDILRMSKTQPDDFDWMSAVHIANDLLVETDGALTEEQTAVLVGLAARMCRQGFEEFRAGIHSEIAITNIMQGGRSHE